jgi:hypothetical protein
MPSSSKKQHNFMAAVANNPSFAKKAGVPQSVGKEFVTADKGKTFKEGGRMAVSKMGKPVMKKGMSTAKDGMKKPTPMADTMMAPAMPMGMKKGGMPMKMKDGKKVPIFMNKGGTASARADGIASKGKTKGAMVKMMRGGKAC